MWKEGRTLYSKILKCDGYGVFRGASNSWDFWDCKIKDQGRQHWELYVFVTTKASEHMFTFILFSASRPPLDLDSWSQCLVQETKNSC